MITQYRSYEWLTDITEKDHMNLKIPLLSLSRPDKILSYYREGISIANDVKCKRITHCFLGICVPLTPPITKKFLKGRQGRRRTCSQTDSKESPLKDFRSVSYKLAPIKVLSVRSVCTSF